MMMNDLSDKLNMPPPPLLEAGERADKLRVQLTATRVHLTRVFWARNVLLLAVCLWIVFMTADSPSRWVVAILAAAALVNLVTWIRLRQPAPVTHGEFLVQMLSDVALITAGLHQYGGANDLYDLSFIPLIIAAATLPWRQTLIVFAAIFSLHELVTHYLPGAIWPDPVERRIELLAGALLAYFVFSLARGSRLHEALLARMREKYLDQRHAAELGTVAASAVHQLSTPLATLAVVVGELRSSLGPSAEQRRALETMARQIDACKQISSRLLAFTGHERAEGGGNMAADKFLARIVEKCRLMQPWVAIEHRARGVPPVPEIVADSSLEQAILVLLHASPGVLRQIEIAHEWDDRYLKIRLYDYGPISSVYADDPAGTPLFSARVPPESKHFDLLMAKAAIVRFGGKIDSRLQGEGSVCMELTLPLSRPKAPSGTHEPR